MTENPTDYEQSEQEENQRDKAYQTLLMIKGKQLKELERLQGKPEELELYLAERHTIYEDMIRQEAEQNPLIWELYQQSKRDNPSRLELAQAKAKRETTPQQRAELTAQAHKRQTFLRIWEQIKSDLTPEEQDKLTRAMSQQLNRPFKT